MRKWTASRTPVVFVHEYAADYRTWEPQMRRFSRSHRCVTYSQRGYPPSDIPNDPDKYSQDCFSEDVIAVMDALKIDKAHIVGHSMGSLTALHVGIRHSQRCISMTAAGCGYGSSADKKIVEDTRAASRETGKMFASTDIKTAAARYADGPTRQAHKNKDPRGYAEFVQNLSETASDDLVIVRSTIELGHNMGLVVIAEGVESDDSWRVLKRLGCDMAQGYFMSPPLPVTQFGEWLDESKWGL